MSVTATEYWADLVEQEGFQACRDGEPPWANPYLFGTSNHTMFELGWDRANETRGVSA